MTWTAGAVEDRRTIAGANPRLAQDAATALELGVPLSLEAGTYHTDWTPPPTLRILIPYSGSVTLLRSDGSRLVLTDTGRGGGVPPVPGIPVARQYNNVAWMAGLGSLATNTGQTANRQMLLPVRFPADCTITAVSISVGTTVVAGSVARLGLWSLDRNNYPVALLADWGQVLTDTSGVKTITGLSTAVLSANRYGLVFLPSGGIGMATFAAGSAMLNYGASGVTGSSGGILVFDDVPAGWTALPTAFTVDGVSGATTVPIIALELT